VKTLSDWHNGAHVKTQSAARSQRPRADGRAKVAS
jgi:hypothetical protein